MADQDLGEEKEHDRCADEPARAGEGEPEQKPEGGKPGNQITRAAEPGEKRRDRAKINRRNFTRVASARVGSMRVPEKNR